MAFCADVTLSSCQKNTSPRENWLAVPLSTSWWRHLSPTTIRFPLTLAITIWQLSNCSDKQSFFNIHTQCQQVVEWTFQVDLSVLQNMGFIVQRIDKRTTKHFSLDWQKHHNRHVTTRPVSIYCQKVKKEKTFQSNDFDPDTPKIFQ